MNFNIQNFTKVIQKLIDLTGMKVILEILIPTEILCQSELEYKKVNNLIDA